MDEFIPTPEITLGKTAREILDAMEQGGNVVVKIAVNQTIDDDSYANVMAYLPIIQATAQEVASGGQVQKLYMFTIYNGMGMGGSDTINLTCSDLDGYPSTSGGSGTSETDIDEGNIK